MLGSSSLAYVGSGLRQWDLPQEMPDVVIVYPEYGSFLSRRIAHCQGSCLRVDVQYCGPLLNTDSSWCRASRRPHGNVR